LGLGQIAFATALALSAGACSFTGSSTPTTFDLSAPGAGGGKAGAGRAQILVPEPITIQAFEGERIIVRDPSGAVSFIGGGQWADRLPRLVQARLIQSFENTSSMSAVGRPGDRTSADYQLNTEIRSFDVVSAKGEAVVEISAKLVNDRTGRIVNARVFTARVPVGAVDASTAAQALDRALSTVLRDVVRWASAGR
jgi:cholesterol transport system auxiliary component